MSKSTSELWAKASKQKGEDRAKTLMKLAQRKLDERQFSDATVLASEAAELFQGTAAVNDLARAHCLAADALRLQERLDEAVDAYKKAIAAGERIFEEDFLGDANHLCGLCLSNLGQFHEGIEYFLTALRIRESGGSDRFAGYSAEFAASCMAQIGDSRFQDFFERAFKHYENDGESSRVAYSRRLFAQSLLNASRASDALQEIGKSYNIYKFLSNELEQARTLVTYGKIEVDLGMFQEARDSFTLAAVNRTTTAFQQIAAEATFELSKLDILEGDFDGYGEIWRLIPSLTSLGLGDLAVEAEGVWDSYSRSLEVVGDTQATTNDNTTNSPPLEGLTGDGTTLFRLRERFHVHYEIEADSLEEAWDVASRLGIGTPDEISWTSSEDFRANNPWKRLRLPTESYEPVQAEDVVFVSLESAEDGRGLNLE